MLCGLEGNPRENRHFEGSLQNYFASRNPHPPHSRTYDRYNKFLRILRTSTPNSHRPFWILARSTGECWRAAPARYWPDTRQDQPARDTQRDIRWDYSGILSGILGGTRWWAALWWHTRRDPLAGGILRGIHSRATLGYSAGPLAGCSGGILGGIHWRAALAGTRRDALASRSGGIFGGVHWRAALAGYWAGCAGQLFWRETGRDPLASRSGGILGGIYWRAALAGYSAGSTGEPLWRDTQRDPLASCRILGGIHWRAALAGYWVGAWCRSIANADSDKQTNNPFLSGGEKQTHIQTRMSIVCLEVQAYTLGAYAGAWGYLRDSN